MRDENAYIAVSVTLTLQEKTKKNLQGWGFQETGKRSTVQLIFFVNRLTP